MRYVFMWFSAFCMGVIFTLATQHIREWCESWRFTRANRKPHPSIIPQEHHKAPKNCKLWAHLDGAYFQNEEGKWVLYWTDGHYV